MYFSLTLGLYSLLFTVIVCVLSNISKEYMYLRMYVCTIFIDRSLKSPSKHKTMHSSRLRNCYQLKFLINRMLLITICNR